eukprot:162042-Prymnesium_polylepis.2
MFQTLHELVRGVCVQPRGWLVEKDDAGVSDELDRNVDPLLLSTGDAAAGGATDDRVLDLEQPEQAHHARDEVGANAVRCVARQPVVCRKPKLLFHGELLDQDIILRHKRLEVAQRARSASRAAEQVAHDAGGGPQRAREQVEER